MCPACAASAAWVMGSVMSTGGITALAVKVLGNKKKSSQHDSVERSKDYVGNHERDSASTDARSVE
jgi:hypothetical protein